MACCQTGADNGRDATADNGICAEMTQLHVGDMHRTALA